MSNFLMFLVLPIIVVGGRLFGWIYALLFGWWLDEREGRSADLRFAQEIREKIWFVFADHGALVVPTEGPLRRVMDCVYTTLEVGNMRLLVLRGRGDLTVRVAPKHLPSDWHELSLVDMVIETPQGIGPRASLSGLDDVRKLLMAKWAKLNEALSEEG